MRITVYRLPSSRWSLEPSPGADPHQAELADGYVVERGAYDGTPIVVRTDKSELGMDVAGAIACGALRVIGISVAP
jgi:hypothetical protein